MKTLHRESQKRLPQKSRKTSQQNLERRIAKGIYIFGLIAFLGLAVPFCVHLYNQAGERREIAERVAFKSAFDGLDALKRTTVDVWWLAENPQATAETFRVFEEKMHEVSVILEAYKDASPEVLKLSERFREFKPGFVLNGTSVYINRPDGSPPYPPEILTVSFLTKDQAKARGAFTPMYDGQYDMLSIPAVRIPPRVYAAVLIHELGHALRHNRHDHGAPKPHKTDSDPYIREEVEMHELGGLILDKSSDGWYYKHLDSVLSRAAKARGFRSALAKITTQDLVDLDKMFECTNADIPSRLISTQFALDVGFRFCDQQGLGMPGKIEVYRWFTSGVFEKW